MNSIYIYIHVYTTVSSDRGGDIPALHTFRDFKARWSDIIFKMPKLKCLSIFIPLFIQQTFLTTCSVLEEVIKMWLLVDLRDDPGQWEAPHHCPPTPSPPTLPPCSFFGMYIPPTIQSQSHFKDGALKETSGWCTWLNPVKASPYTSKVLLGGLLISQLLKTRLVGKSPGLLNRASTNLRASQVA